MNTNNEQNRYVRSGTKLYVNLRTGTIVKKRRGERGLKRGQIIGHKTLKNQYFQKNKNATL